LFFTHYYNGKNLFFKGNENIFCRRAKTKKQMPSPGGKHLLFYHVIASVSEAIQANFIHFHAISGLLRRFRFSQ